MLTFLLGDAGLADHKFEREQAVNRYFLSFNIFQNQMARF
jgi:hypothetical protein